METATAGLVRALVAHGHDVHLLSPRGQAPMPGVTRHTLGLPPLGRLGRTLALAVGARVVLARGGWDVVQSHERTLGQDVYRAGEGCHRAYLASRGARRAGLYDRLVVALETRVFATTPELVAIARRGKAEIEQLYAVDPGRVTVVYNGVDLERFHPRNADRHRRHARAEAGIPDDAWLGLFMGSGFERKGVAGALEALAALDDRASRLLVVGKGDPRPYRALTARLRVDGRVTWLGPRPDAERWYAAADVVVLPSRYEPFGNVHLEALASGIPVVASAEAGGAEVIVDGDNGAVADPHSPAAIASAITRLRAQPLDRVRARARASAEPFTYARQVGELTAIYRRVRRETFDFR